MLPILGYLIWSWINIDNVLSVKRTTHGERDGPIHFYLQKKILCEMFAQGIFRLLFDPDDDGQRTTFQPEQVVNDSVKVLDRTFLEKELALK